MRARGSCEREGQVLTFAFLSFIARSTVAKAFRLPERLRVQSYAERGIEKRSNNLRHDNDLDPKGDLVWRVLFDRGMRSGDRNRLGGDPGRPASRDPGCGGLR
jgi:hypothetical protein